MVRWRGIATIAAVVVLSSCSVAQVTAWHDWFQRDPVQAQTALDAYSAMKADVTAERPCEEWFDLSLEVGWTADQWPTLSRVMWGESRCDPFAHNPSGATGLTQIMPMWIDDCGGGDLRDPVFNLTCALHILMVAGWPSWSAF
jgi:hypothetical protein